MRGSKLYGIIAAAFVAGVFLASPELRAYAAAKWTSEDIVDETIRTIDIMDGEVKTEDIADGTIQSIDIDPDVIPPNKDLKVVQRTQTVSLLPGEQNSAVAACDVNEIILSGGFSAGRNILVHDSHTDGAGGEGQPPVNSWLVAGVNQGTTTQNLVALAYCGQLEAVE